MSYTNKRSTKVAIFRIDDDTKEHLVSSPNKVAPAELTMLRALHRIIPETRRSRRRSSARDSNLRQNRY